MSEVRESGSCGASRLCLQRASRLSSAAEAQKRRFRLISLENVTPGQRSAMPRAAPYYCIARGGELWFERLDFDAFQLSGRGASKTTPKE
jgi:putative hemolysin